jgi:hypothetical protein
VRTREISLIWPPEQVQAIQIGQKIDPDSELVRPDQESKNPIIGYKIVRKGTLNFTLPLKYTNDFSMKCSHVFCTVDTDSS